MGRNGVVNVTRLGPRCANVGGLKEKRGGFVDCKPRARPHMSKLLRTAL